MDISQAGGIIRLVSGSEISEPTALHVLIEIAHEGLPLRPGDHITDHESADHRHHHGPKNDHGSHENAAHLAGVSGTLAYGAHGTSSGSGAPDGPFRFRQDRLQASDARQPVSRQEQRFAVRGGVLHGGGDPAELVSLEDDDELFAEFMVEAMLRFSAGATFNLRFAQNTQTSSTAARTKKGSILRYRKLPTA